MIARSAATLALALAVTALVGGSSGAAARPARSERTLPAVRSVAPVASYRPPVSPLHVVRGFVAPVTRFGAGHRGVDLAVAPGGVVRSAGAGLVTFAGRVAGRGVVVVLHPDGVRTEYEPLDVAVRAGQAVAAGAVLGVVHGKHGTCAPSRCLHWGARRDGEYFDPLLLLRPLGPVRLLPWSGP